MDVGIAPEVLRQLAEAEAARRPKSTGPEDVKELEKQMVGHFCLLVLQPTDTWNPATTHPMPSDRGAMCTDANCRDRKACSKRLK